MLSHDVSFGSECCKPVTIFKSCGNTGECADVLLTRRAGNQGVQYDALVKSQQERVDVAMTREWDKWNEFGVTEVSVQEAAERHQEAKPRSQDRGNQMDDYGEGHPGQARQQGPVGCARVSRRQGAHQDRCAHYAFFMTLSTAAQDGWELQRV